MRGRRPDPPDNQLGFAVDEFLPGLRGSSPTLTPDVPRDRSGRIFNPAELVDRLITANLESTAIDVDAVADLPKAANVFEWINDPRFCNQDPPVLPKSVEFLVSLFEDFCPDCSDPRLVRPETVEHDSGDGVRRHLRYDIRLPSRISLGELQERVQLLQFGICPRCRKNRRDFARAGKFHHPQEGVIVAGQRSTKTHTAAFAWAYTLHRFLVLPDPARRFGIPRGQWFETIFTAITAAQAYKTLWWQAMTVYGGAPWFAQLGDLLRAEGRRLGRELYKYEQTFIAFPSKHIACYYGPPAGDSQRGRTRIFAAVSEWGWFAQKKRVVQGNEEDLYTGLVNSLVTIRAAGNRAREGEWFDAPMAIMMNEGSPKAAQDKGMRLLNEESTNPRFVCRHYDTFTWNFNLRPSDITKPRPGTPDFERDYMAVPPLADSPFIEHERSALEAIDPGRINAISYQVERFIEERAGVAQPYIWLQTTMLPPDRFAPRVIAVDAGQNHDSFAVVCARVNPEHQTVVEWVAEAIPMEGADVHFPSMLDRFLLPFCEKYNVRYLVWDRWQSLEAKQRASAKLFNALTERISLRPADFREFRTRALAGRVRLLSPEMSIKALASRPARIYNPVPAARLLLQLLTVRQVGQKVEKPLNGTDDLFRALVLADHVADQHRQILASATGRGGMPETRDVGVVAFRSQAGQYGGPRPPSRIGAFADSRRRRARLY